MPGVMKPGDIALKGEVVKLYGCWDKMFEKDNSQNKFVLEMWHLVVRILCMAQQYKNSHQLIADYQACFADKGMSAEDSKTLIKGLWFICHGFGGSGEINGANPVQVEQLLKRSDNIPAATLPAPQQPDEDRNKIMNDLKNRSAVMHAFYPARSTDVVWTEKTNSKSSQPVLNHDYVQYLGEVYIAKQESNPGKEKLELQKELIRTPMTSDERKYMSFRRSGMIHSKCIISLGIPRRTIQATGKRVEEDYDTI